jgi:AAA+ ATPase superfamily predicted ATPase
VRLRFLNRGEERRRLERLLRKREGALAVVYGRRRLGKSRLIQEVLSAERTVYYVGDDRESVLQRQGLAVEIGRLLPGFDAVEYPGWDALLDRWWAEAASGSVLVLDEFPSLTSAAPELPSLLQKHIDSSSRRGIHLILTGSSQRMMQGLALDRSAPLFGRASELLRIMPLTAGWIQTALGIREAVPAIESFAVWGGVPRYWELAADHEDLRTAIRELVLSPLGVLHDEPRALLLDDTRDATQAASILTLIGQGCHRLSEIAGRLGKPATSLSRPVQRLTELGLVRRDAPFGASARAGGRSVYRIDDPFLRFWFRLVEPNRSRLATRWAGAVTRLVESTLPQLAGEVWEELARESVPLLGCCGRSWGPASRWWGPGRDRTPMEIDVVAESEDGEALLLGDVEWGRRTSGRRLLGELQRKADNLTIAAGRQIHLAIWHRGDGIGTKNVDEVRPARVLKALRRA